MRPAEDFWNKVEWEGGVLDALDYGLMTYDYDLPVGVHELWSDLRSIYDEMRPVISELDSYQDDFYESQE